MHVLPRLLVRVALLAATVAWVAHVSVVVWGPGSASRVSEAVVAEMHIPTVGGVDPAELNAPATAAVESLWSQLGNSDRPENVIDWVMNAAEAAGQATPETPTQPESGAATPAEALSSVERVSSLASFMRPLENLLRPALGLWFVCACIALLCASGSRPKVLRNHGFWAIGAGVATLLIGFALRYASERFDWFVLTGTALRAAWLPLYAQAGFLIGLGFVLLLITLAAGLVPLGQSKN
jgi:hypothetical protein